MISQPTSEVQKMIKELDSKCYSWEADLAQPTNITRLFDLAEEKFWKVDILVNNAAFDNPDTFIPQKKLEKNPLFAEEYMMHPISSYSHDQHFVVNSRAVALMMGEYASRYLDRRANWGRIINITTDGARCHASNVSYGASKYAIESYSRSAAMELGPYGIIVNVVSPGAVQKGWIPPELEKKLSESYPLRRIGRPEDIAKAILFFSSEQADWITGQVLYVGGGNGM